MRLKLRRIYLNPGRHSGENCDCRLIICYRQKLLRRSKVADIFQYADDIGPTKIIYVYEPSIKLKAILVVDNVARGPSIGGVAEAKP